jgi:hypothetical protein
LSAHRFEEECSFEDDPEENELFRDEDDLEEEEFFDDYYEE